jgi:hypothetical protein
VAVFVDEAAEYVNPSNTPYRLCGGWDVDRRDGNVKVDAAVGTSRVVVIDIGGQDAFKMAAVPDENPVQALDPGGAYPPLGVGVGPRIQLHRMRRIGSDVSG